MLRDGVFQFHALATTQTFACLLDPFQKAFVMFELVFKPIVFGREADQHTSRLAVSSEHDRLLLGLPQEFRKVFGISQGDLFHRVHQIVGAIDRLRNAEPIRFYPNRHPAARRSATPRETFLCRAR